MIKLSRSNFLVFNGREKKNRNEKHGTRRISSYCPNSNLFVPKIDEGHWKELVVVGSS